MRCTECGTEVRPGETICSRCRGEIKVQVLTPHERENFEGITIDQEGFQRENPRYKNECGHNHRVYVRHVQFGGTGLLTKLVIVAILALLVMLALPLALFALAAGIIWFLLRWQK